MGDSHGRKATRAGGEASGSRSDRYAVNSDEEFMRDLQPHVERTVRNICSALGKQCGETGEQNVRERLTDATSNAISSMRAAGGMKGREELEVGLRRARILRKAQERRTSGVPSDRGATLDAGGRAETRQG
jgi:hypothetical protein